MKEKETYLRSMTQLTTKTNMMVILVMVTRVTAWRMLELVFRLLTTGW